MSTPKTLLEKIWDLHRITARDDGETLLYVDYNVVHEGPFYAFDGLRQQGRKVRRPKQTLAFADHYVPTIGRARGTAAIIDPEARTMVEQLARNAQETGIYHFGLQHARQGIMHVVTPELGVAQPGMLVVGSDSHTCTYGAFGAFSFGVGASQIKHILATQTVWMRRPRTLRVTISGRLASGVCAKDVVLAVIARLGLGAGAGQVIEYTGDAVHALSIEARMTLGNMAIECGALSGMVAPDETLFAYLKGREFAPSGAHWDAAVRTWRDMVSDPGARFDGELSLDGDAIEPMSTWGTSPDEAVGVAQAVPDPRDIQDADRRKRALSAIEYMELKPGTRLRDIPIDRVFIGSCTNARIEDLREVAAVVKGRKAVVPVLVVPGSMAVKRAAQAEGIDRVLTEAGFEWRDAGCSMCTGSNGDRVPAGERCVSTSNRNFEGRQGRGSRTHLVGPATAAASALTGRIADAREFVQGV